MEEEYTKEQKIKDKTEKQKDEELVKSAMKVKLELEVARNNFEYAEDELIDYFAYQIKANQSKLDYLLGKIKKRGIILDIVAQRELKNKKAM